MKENIGLNTKEAIKNLLLALKNEHPEILRDGGNIRSKEYANFLITVSKLQVTLESYSGNEDFYKSLSISALGAGNQCPTCSGSGKI